MESYRAEVLPEAEKAYKARLNAYKQRRETWPNVLDTQSELYMRQSEYVRNLVAWRESQTLIEGFLLTWAWTSRRTRPHRAILMQPSSRGELLLLHVKRVA